jgi:hypothetical protein
MLISPGLREVVVQRAGNRCEYCRLAQESQVATFPVDHVIPVVRDGPTESENLALACTACNTAKWTHVDAQDPETGQFVRLFDPRTQDWSEHFRWLETDPTRIEPLTVEGRATIALLDLDSPSRRQIRRWLIVVKAPPPP